MLGLSYFVPLVTRPCEYEVNPPAIVRACLIGMTAWLRWLPNGVKHLGWTGCPRPFSEYRHPSYKAVFFT